MTASFQTPSRGEVSMTCSASQVLFTRGEKGELWRVVEGHVCVEFDDGNVRQPVQLAQPGDFVGLESLMGQAYQCTATALTRVRVERVDVAGETRSVLLQRALQQQGERMVDMARLRTGTVAMRLSNLLLMLGYPSSGHRLAKDRPSSGTKLPTLRDMARIVDAKHETVCRVLKQLVPSRGRSSVNEEVLAAA